MQNREDDFSPLLVDQQIENPTSSLPRKEAHLIHDLQAMYDQENRATIDRVWMRLTHQQPELHAYPRQGQSLESISAIKHRDAAIREPHQTNTSVRRLGLVAALLVASLMLTFAVFRWGIATGMPVDPASGWGSIVHVQTMPDYGFNGLAWSPDNKRIATSNRAVVSNNDVRIWDATTGQHLVDVPVAHFVNTIAWSPNSQQVAIVMSQSVVIVDGQTGHVLHTFTTLSQPSALISSSVVLLSSRSTASGGPEYRDVTWSPDDSQIAVSSFGDTTESSVLVWNLHTGALFHLLLKGNNGIEGVSWSSNGKYLAADTFLMAGTDPLHQSGVVVWNVATRRIVLQKDTGSLPDVNGALAWQPGTQNLAQIGVVKTESGYTTAILIFDGTTGKTLKQLLVPVSDVLTWSPDGKYLAYTSPADVEKGNAAQILDASNWHNVYSYTDGKNIINELAWSPDGHSIATGETVIDNDTSMGVVKVWKTLD